MEQKMESAAKEDQDKDSGSPGSTMNLRKFRKATAKRKQMLDKEVCKKKKKMLMIKSASVNHLEEDSIEVPVVAASELSSETSNTMTMEQFADIVLASEGMTLNNNNDSGVSVAAGETASSEMTAKEELEKKAMVATILQNKDLTVEVKTAKSKPVVLSPRENASKFNNYHNHSVVVSVKPRTIHPQQQQPSRYNSKNLVEEWLKKLPTPDSSSASPISTSSTVSAALNLSLKTPSCQQYSNNRSHPAAVSSNISSSAGAFNTMPKTSMDGFKSRAVRDIQLAHTKDMHGNYPLHMSVLMRKPELVKRYCCILHILEASLDLINDEKHTPLHLAVRDNSLEIVEILLAFGANPSIRDFRGNTCLHMATAVRSSEALKLLVESTNSKEELNSFNDLGITPLHIAMMNDDKPCIDILLRFGADPKILNDLIKLSSLPKDVKSESPNGELDYQANRKNVMIHT